MKTRLVLFISAVVMFYSCEEDAFSYSFDTNVETTITVDIEDNGLKNTLHPFVVIDTLNLSDNDEIKKYIESIRDIDIDSVTCKLNGIPENEEITELNITILETGMSIKLTNLTENNNKIVLDINNAVIDAVSSFLYTNQFLIIQIDGESTTAPMKLDVSLDFKTKVKASLL